MECVGYDMVGNRDGFPVAQYRYQRLYYHIADDFEAPNMSAGEIVYYYCGDCLTALTIRKEDEF